MKQLDFRKRCNCNGKELQKTHYTFGKEGKKKKITNKKNRLGSSNKIQRRLHSKKEHI